MPQNPIKLHAFLLEITKNKRLIFVAPGMRGLDVSRWWVSFTLIPSNAEATFVQIARIFENHLNPVMLILIGKLSLRTLIWVPICQGSSHFLKVFLHHFLWAKLATSSIMVIWWRGQSATGLSASPPPQMAALALMAARSWTGIGVVQYQYWLCRI